MKFFFTNNWESPTYILFKYLTDFGEIDINFVLYLCEEDRLVSIVTLVLLNLVYYNLMYYRSSKRIGALF